MFSSAAFSVLWQLEDILLMSGTTCDWAQTLTPVEGGGDGEVDGGGTGDADGGGSETPEGEEDGDAEGGGDGETDGEGAAGGAGDGTFRQLSLAGRHRSEPMKHGNLLALHSPASVDLHKFNSDMT